MSIKKPTMEYENIVTLTVRLKENATFSDRDINIGTSKTTVLIGKANAYWPNYNFGMLNFYDPEIVKKAKDFKIDDVLTFTGKVWNRYNNTIKKTFLSFEVLKIVQHKPAKIKKPATKAKKVANAKKIIAPKRKYGKI